MREIRIIAGIAVALIVFVAVSFVWTMATATAGPLDAQAVRRIERQCGFQAECKVQLGNLFSGDWDTFYEFGVGVDQATIDSALGTNRVKRANHQRTLVLMKDGRIVTAEHENYGTQQPLAGQVEFEDEHHREQRWVSYDRNTFLRVSSFRADPAKGSYYVLTAVEP